MMDEVKLAKLRKFFNLRPSFSEVVFKGEQFLEILDSLDALLKIARAAQRFRDQWHSVATDEEAALLYAELCEALSALNPVNKKETP